LPADHLRAILNLHKMTTVIAPHPGSALVREPPWDAIKLGRCSDKWKKDNGKRISLTKLQELNWWPNITTPYQSVAVSGGVLRVRSKDFGASTTGSSPR
jgi:hypothetical protein